MPNYEDKILRKSIKSHFSYRQHRIFIVRLMIIIAINQPNSASVTVYPWLVGRNYDRAIKILFWL